MEVLEEDATAADNSVKAKRRLMKHRHGGWEFSTESIII